MPSHANLCSSIALLCGLIAGFSAPAQAAEVVLRFGSINTEGTLAYEQVLVPFARH